MCLVVIKDRIAVEVPAGTKGAFNHNGAWYMWERDWENSRNRP